MPIKKYHHGDLKNALIQAGIKILAKEGVGGLSLRKVAQKAGVSHSAPYSHFPDKQALIAAISTEGFRQLYSEIEQAVLTHSSDPKQQLMEGAWAYVQFAINNPDTYKIMFSGDLEKEKDYPAFVEISRKNFELVLEIVKTCQAAGILRPAPPELAALSVWGQLHGIISLILDGQVPHEMLDKISLREIGTFAMSQMITGLPQT